MAYKIDPITGLRRKSGGRQFGTPNKTTSARHAAMQRVNEALAKMGDDTLTGMKLLSEVLKHPDTPLDVKIQCAGLLTRHEDTTPNQKQYVAYMPTPLPAGSTKQQMAIWWALHKKTEDNDDPEWVAACNRVLELAATKNMPETLS